MEDHSPAPSSMSAEPAKAALPHMIRVILEKLGSAELANAQHRHVQCPAGLLPEWRRAGAEPSGPPRGLIGVLPAELQSPDAVVDFGAADPFNAMTRGKIPNGATRVTRPPPSANSCAGQASTHIASGPYVEADRDADTFHPRQCSCRRAPGHDRSAHFPRPAVIPSCCENWSGLRGRRGLSYQRGKEHPEWFGRAKCHRSSSARADRPARRREARDQPFREVATFCRAIPESPHAPPARQGCRQGWLAPEAVQENAQSLLASRSD